ncbi:uncharacterized protein KD926_008371 [Aspergillus affinis]|uniref:uncharacterized protein n=1 Tax=Aspergillus affinis TaxID=1070780 RepID=UPI0022FE6B57|nr:uncharacterized protein KD926_008371 [Aspergillus affinis]KAI9040281.1 hypothetical protein KD926_008371 [Aspergillus affinis]
MDDTSRQLAGQAYKSLHENAWLNGLHIPDDEMDAMRRVQNTYIVQLDSSPDMGYKFRIHLIWDYDRIWGMFDFGWSRGVFLIDPGLKPIDCDDDGQLLPFTWRGVNKASPENPYGYEAEAKGEICINALEETLEGFFGFMAGNGSAGSDTKCAFHAKRHFGPQVVPNSLENIVKEWNDYCPDFRKETVRQNQPDSALAEYLEINNQVVIRKPLQAALDDIQATGAFITGGSQETAVNPGLHISNVGNIRLPIFAEEAKAIIKSCRLSPYGKGTETLVNESVRKSWQLDADQVSFQNPQWNAEVGRWAHKAATGLGLEKSAEVKAEFYKLLVYEKDAFFLSHQDSEKADGMFGTLVISLPSKHEGGNVIASHRDKKLEFATAPKSEFGYTWAAWYADVSHEVKPVTSGYRIVLVYNLIHRPSAALLPFRSNKAESLTDLLKSWALGAKRPGQYLDGWDESDFREACPPALIYVFEHQYTEAELSFARLKGVDRQRFAELQNACQKADFVILLANIEKNVTGGVDESKGDYYGGYYGGSDSDGSPSVNSDGVHSIQDMTECSLELSHVVNAEGQVVGTHVPFVENMLVPADVFDRSPDDEDFGGYTGNEGATTTHFYKQTGILILPKEFDFLFQLQKLRGNDDELQQALKQGHRVIKENPNDTTTKERLRRICRVALESTYLTDSVMEIAFELDDMPLFCRSMGKFRGQFSIPQSSQIAKIIFHHGLDAICSALDAYFSRKSGYMYKVLSFSEQITSISRLAAEFQSICERQNQKPSAEVTQWWNGKLDTILLTELKGLESEGPILAEALSESPAPGFLQKSVTFLETNMLQKPLILSFIVSVHEFSKTGNIDKGEVGQAIDRLFPAVIKNFKVESTTPLDYRDIYLDWSLHAHPQTSRVSPDWVIKLVKLADATNTNSTGIMDKLVEYAGNVKQDDTGSTFHEFLFPIAGGISEHIATTKRPVSPGEQKFFTWFLKAYLTGYIKIAPPPPPDWKERTTIRCTCDDCGSLRRFINDIDAPSKDFGMAEKRRKHLDQQIDKSYFFTSTIKSGTPHKLRVEKTRAQEVSNYLGWIKRARAGQAQLDRLSQQGPLQDILAENYNSIVNHRNLKVPENLPSSLLSLTQENLSKGRSTVPQKRGYRG